MATNFLNLQGLTTLLNQLKEKFSTADEISAVETDTDTYVLNVDYSLITFDTSEIISSDETSPSLDVGLLDLMILA